MAGKPVTLKNTKEKIKDKFNIQESRNVRKFLGVYYEWGCDAKGTYENITTEKDVNKLVEGYKKYTCSDVTTQKNSDAPGTTLSKSDLEEPYNMDKYRSLVVQLIWFTDNNAFVLFYF